MFVFFLFISSCEKNQEPIIEDKTEYRDTVWDTMVTPNLTPLLNSMDMNANDKTLSFLNLKDNTYQVYQMDLTKGSKPYDIGFETEKTVLEIKNDDDSIYCILRDEENRLYLAETSKNEKKDNEIAFSGFTLDTYVVRFFLTEDYIVLLTKNQVVIFNRLGEYLNQYVQKNVEMVDCHLVDSETIFITWREKDDSVKLIQLSLPSLQVVKELELEANGIFYDETNLFCIKENQLCKYHLSDEIYESILELKQYNILPYHVLDVMETGEQIYVLEKDSISGKSPIYCHVFQKNDKLENDSKGNEPEFAETNRQTIKILCIEAITDAQLADIIVAYNKQSNLYQVELENISIKGSSLDDVYLSINTRLVSKESADLLYLWDYVDMQRYTHNNVFADLTPFLEKEGMDRFQASVLDCFRENNKIYGISNRFSVRTLCGKSSLLGTKTGWTTDEFLEWIKQNPDIKAFDGLSHHAILEFCLKGDIKEYVDFENNGCDFTGQGFKDLLEKIHKLRTDTTPYYDNWWEVCSENQIFIDDYDLYNFNGFMHLERTYNDVCNFIGYPSLDGEPVYKITMPCMSVLSNSTCPEGSFDFLKYYMDNALIDFDTCFYLDNELMEQSIVNSKEPVLFNNEDESTITVYLTDEQRNRILQMIQLSQRVDLRERRVQEIVLEESDQYFQDIKSLDSVCNIIQNRVNLFLNQ